jgi:predicted lipoprotein with Yx(FWY)xxD motif
MNTKGILPVAVALGALAIASAALGESAHSSTARAVVSTRHTSLGTILTTGSGHTLYIDAGAACTSGCLSIWPPLKTSGAPKASGGAKAALLGTTKGPGGIKQVTYKGHALFTFASAATGTSGEGQNGFYVLSPSGSKITKSTNTAPTTGSSGNYNY